MKILVSGATGYVGSRLVPRLLVAGHEVSCLVRQDSRVSASFAKDVRLVRGDALQDETLAEAMRGIEVAYYLIHSMGATGDFKDNDRRAAQNFASAAKIAGVQRIVFLGALASNSAEISSHLQSRHETGDTLRHYGPPVTEFRAGIIVGNGSVSFELIRYLTERLPVMICPRWVITRTQPIAIEDVLQYLEAAVSTPASTGQTIEIGGASVETYRSMMLTYARARGLRRWLIRVPILTPRLSSYWLRLITPLPTSITRPLIEGLRTEVVCTSAKAAELFAGIRPVGYSEAIQKTLARPLPDDGLTQGVPPTPGHFFVQKEGLLCDIRQEVADASPREVFAVISRLGGSNGYLYANSLWRMRGWMDSWLGGVGMTRGLADTGLSKDGRTDFWYVEDFEVSRRVLLRAEMKLPGRAWLEFVLSPQADQTTLVSCCAWFEPWGLLGELYWWMLYPIHILIFRGMVRAVCKRAERGALAIATAVRNPS